MATADQHRRRQPQMHGQAVTGHLIATRMRGQQAGRQHPHPQSRRHTSQNRLHRPIALLPGNAQPALGRPIQQPGAVMAPFRKHDQRHLVATLRQSRIQRQHQAQLFLPHLVGEQARMLERTGHQRRIQLQAQHPLDEQGAGAGLQLHRHLGCMAMKTRQHIRKARGCGGFHRAQPQAPLQRVQMHAAPGRIAQAVQLPRIRQQALARSGEAHLLPPALQQRAAKLLLKLAQARRHIRGHAVEPARRRTQAAQFDHGMKVTQQMRIEATGGKHGTQPFTFSER